MKRKRFWIMAFVLALVLALLPARHPARAATYTVTNTNNAAWGSLRQAIIDANKNPGRDTIKFDIPIPGNDCNFLTGVCIIQPTSPLPALTDDDGTTIDGYTQPGALEATDSTSATLKIEIDGYDAGDGADGLTITSANNVIKGLAIRRFSRNGIRISSSGAMTNTVSGNYIGTDASGTADLGNGDDGVSFVNGPQNSTVGGTTAGERNIISGNDDDGIYIAGETRSIIVCGNYIGTDASGTAALGNDWDGVYIWGDAHNNTVGPGNVIAHNGWDGVGVNGSSVTGNIITQNSIFSNTLGINLTGGANGDIAAPVIFTTTLGSVNVVGTACPNCTVEVFENSDTDGEGETYVGDTTADAGGAFTVIVSSLSHPYLTATATDEVSGTSEFSTVFTATVPLAPPAGPVYLPIILRNAS